MGFIQKAISEIARALLMFVMSLLNILPNSPFELVLNYDDSTIREMLGFINYFIPFDVCSELLLIWISCVTAWYVYNFVKGTLSVKNSFLDKILKFLL